MNPLFIVFGIGMLVAGVFFVKELIKPPQRNTPSYPRHQMPQYPQQQPMNVNDLRASTQQSAAVPRKDYRQAYSQLQQEMKTKKEENRLSPQSRTHFGNPRQAFKTVDTDYEQAKTKMWGINEAKQPTNPEEYDTERDSTMYWSRKQGTLYLLLAIVSLTLVLMLGV